MLKIYIILPRRDLPKEKDTFHGYDIVTGFVVIASDENEARSYVYHCGDECRDQRGSRDDYCVWRDPEVTECKAIGVALAEEQAGIVMEEWSIG